jgi:hypothetical protein
MQEHVCVFSQTPIAWDFYMQRIGQPSMLGRYAAIGMSTDMGPCRYSILNGVNSGWWSKRNDRESAANMGSQRFRLTRNTLRRHENQRRLQIERNHLPPAIVIYPFRNERIAKLSHRNCDV